jgi:hypothetical protein
MCSTGILFGLKQIILKHNMNTNIVGINWSQKLLLWVMIKKNNKSMGTENS